MAQERTVHSAALLANITVVGLAAGLALLAEAAPDRYYRMVQEDGVVEWATFWAFLFAAAAAAGSAWRGRRSAPPGAACLAGVALFCAFVALEEISWGQRLVGYRPPAYFLENNFQQEFNLHNVADTSLRTLAVKAVIAGYGVLAPLALRTSLAARHLGWARPAVPPLALAPAFLATLLLYVWYPLRFSGEIVECMLGLGFLFAMLRSATRRRHPVDSLPPPRDRPPGAGLIFVSALAVAALGVAGEAGSETQRTHPELLRAARIELDTLSRDVQRLAADRGGALPGGCRVHKRLYHYAEKYAPELHTLEFSELAARGETERLGFFLDPWNSPYWIRSTCGDAQDRRTFIYSLGPNRRRDSSAATVRGDDLGSTPIGAPPAGGTASS